MAARLEYLAKNVTTLFGDEILRWIVNGKRSNDLKYIVFFSGKVFKKIIYPVFAVVAFFAGYYYLQPSKKGKGIYPYARYELVKEWPALSNGLNLGSPTGIATDTNQNIFVFHRAGRTWPLIGSMPGSRISSETILLLDKNTGKVMASWGSGIFIMPHGLAVDKNNNVWVTDVGLQQVFKFDHNGKLLMQLGEPKVAGRDSVHFNRPTDIAVAEDGSFYVSDGYRNSRIIKFSSNGKYLLQWGRKGDKEGEFDIPHGIDLDNRGNVYVADRENNRIQVFDPTGKFLKQWTGKNVGNICSVAFEKRKGKLVAVDDHNFLKIKHRGSDVFVFDSSGNIETRFGRSGLYSGPAGWFHDIAIDAEENIYIGDIQRNKVLKFKLITSEKNDDGK